MQSCCAALAIKHNQMLYCSCTSVIHFSLVGAVQKKQVGCYTQHSPIWNTWTPTLLRADNSHKAHIFSDAGATLTASCLSKLWLAGGLCCCLQAAVMTTEHHQILKQMQMDEAL